VDKLSDMGACAGLVPLSIGSVTVDELDVGRITSLSPFGDASGLSAASESAHGIGWPDVGHMSGRDGARLVWFGRNEVVLMGPAPDDALAKHAAVVDVSDAWAVVSIEGETAVDVLARLVPVDLRLEAIARGATVRTQVGHMAVSITRLGGDSFMVLVFRSMASTLIHELKQAMVGFAARS
jgi:heterotetrameric sarcosine oxidase gamma subunit